jgi:hypothetical protein
MDATQATRQRRHKTLQPQMTTVLRNAAVEMEMYKDGRLPRNCQEDDQSKQQHSLSPITTTINNHHLLLPLNQPPPPT